MNNNLFIRFKLIKAIQYMFYNLVLNRYGCSIIFFLLEKFGIELKNAYKAMEGLKKNYEALMRGDSNGPYWNGAAALRFYKTAKNNLAKDIVAYKEVFKIYDALQNMTPEKRENIIKELENVVFDNTTNFKAKRRNKSKINCFSESCTDGFISGTEFIEDYEINELINYM